MDHLTEQFLDILLGALPAKEQQAADAHLASCSECSQALLEQQRIQDAVLAAAPEEVPPSRIGENLAQAVQGRERFAHFVGRVSQLFDLSEAEAAAVLQRVDQREGWEPGPGSGTEVMPVAAGKRLDGALTAMVRISPGGRIPQHFHRGEEINLVIQGGFSEHGREVWRGDLVVESDGSAHEQIGMVGIDCIAAVVVHGFIEFEPEPA